MRVLVDADACPVKEIIIKICKEKNIDVVMFTDYAHEIYDGYSQVIKVDTATDSVDFKLINHMKEGDIVVTQDYGLASMALGKGGIVLSQNGFRYTNETIDQMLFERHIGQQLRKAGQRGSHIPKRSKEQDEKFTKIFLTVL